MYCVHLSKPYLTLVGYVGVTRDTSIYDVAMDDPFPNPK